MKLIPASRTAKQTFMNHYAVKAGKFTKMAAKTNLSQTSTAYRNRIYGANWAVLYEQMASVRAAMPTRDEQDKTGWRVAIAAGNPDKSSTTGSTARGGVPEGGKIPGVSIPDLRELHIDHYTIDRVFGITDDMEVMAQRRIDDLAVQNVNVLRNNAAAEMLKEINRMLTQPMEPYIDAASANFAHPPELSSLDMIISSVARATLKQNNGSYVGFYNYGDLPRDGNATGVTAGNTATDSTVISCEDGWKRGDALTETLGELQPRHFKMAKYGVHKASGRWPTFWVISIDVQEYLDNLFEGLQRYNAVNGVAEEHITGPGTMNVGYGVGGGGLIPNMPGNQAGYQVMAFDGIPFVSTTDETYDTATANLQAEMGHVYGVRTGVEPYSGMPGMFISRRLPLTYKEASVVNSPSNLILKGDHNSTGLWTLKEELICQVPTAQAVIMNVARA